MSQPQHSHSIGWSDEEYQSFGLMQARTMGTDPVRNSGWRQVDIAGDAALRPHNGLQRTVT